MALRYPTASFEDGDVVTPLEYTKEITGIAGEMSGYIDRENVISSGLRGNSLAPNAVNRIWFIAPGTIGSPWAIEEPIVGVGSGFKDVPNVNVQADCVSGALDLEAYISWHLSQDDWNNKPRMQIAISVDNEIVSCTMPEGLHKYIGDSKFIEVDGGTNQKPGMTLVRVKLEYATLHTQCVYPVTEGVKDIRLLSRFVYDEEADYNRRGDMKTQVLKAGLWIRNMRR